MQILPDSPLLQLANPQHFLFKPPMIRDVRANSDILRWLSVLVHKRKNRRVHPVDAPVLGPIANIAAPNAARGDGGPQVPEKLLRVVSGIDDAVVPAQQLIS